MYVLCVHITIVCTCMVTAQCSLQVNTIAWNESGTRLLSGSDDCHLKIYDAGSGLVGSLVEK